MLNIFLNLYKNLNIKGYNWQKHGGNDDFFHLGKQLPLLGNTPFFMVQPLNATSQSHLSTTYNRQIQYYSLSLSLKCTTLICQSLFASNLIMDFTLQIYIHI